MRLDEKEQQSISKCVEALDPASQVYLFGSRANDQLRGGDLDLLVISERLSFADKLKLLIELKEKLGDQKIDIILKKRHEIDQDPFVRKIWPTAVRL